MKEYKVKIEPDALCDIISIMKWYDEQQAGLGRKFKETSIKQINRLKNDAQIYTIRYKEIRCVPVKRFPYLVHFYINLENNTVEVLAVISTDRNPKIWEEKTGK